ncbi:EAL domain-containing protein [Desulfovibrio sulfodismutans]|uniref:EAL domain-containing protein n=1 Tax=Desulfolutivibrio sulfodismutans TaxID=63561 RepID=A0A7K3NIW0_9BACT|nr:EAL domain-containing protein [Desulfolutivibrio sulfodismutans]NDY56136.1 EAL domain-containing protein [Desulfolutivibrio sulfodismutans]QLA13188.1 EAL domain-containing protein [Desulfolutivibrio sulfodismutans DSM 3696]
MNKRFEGDAPLTLRDELIGLGERSSRKSFYPELKKRLGELERTSLLLDQAPDAVLLMAWERLSILEANAAALRLLGKSRDEVVGESALVFFPMLEKVVAKDAVPGREALHLAEMIAADGAVFEISLSRQTVNGRLYGMLMARDVTQRTRMQEELNQRVSELTLLNEVGFRLASSSTVDAAIKNIVESIERAIQTDMILFFLKEGGRLILRAHKSHDPDFDIKAFSDHVVDHCLCGSAAANGMALYSGDIDADPLCSRPECKRAGIRSAAVLPLRLFGEVRGVIALGSITPRDFQVHGPLLESLAAILFTGLQNATLYQEARAHVEELGNTVRSLLEAEQALKISESRLKLALEAANEGLWDWNVASGEVYFSPGYYRMLGFEPEAVASTVEGWMGLIHPHDVELVKRLEVEHLGRHKEKYEFEFRMRDGSGDWRWILSKGKVVERDRQGNALRVVGTHSDITARKEMEGRLRHMALHDALTGLANRTLCLERIERAVARAKRHEESKFAVLFIDLDRFKVINDSLGHLFGDQVIIQIGNRIKNCVREADTVARLGGDEFLVVLEELESGRFPVQAIKRIRQAICEPIIWEGRAIQVTASIGAELWAGLRADAQEVIRNADLAMHWAKAKGRNRFKVFTERLFRHAVTRMTLERDMDHGLASGEFFLVFQPIVELGADGGKDRIRGLEALMRWRHPERGLISPSEFIPIAEETGKIRELTSLALTLACRTLAGWRSRLPAAADLYMAVNVSAKDLLRSDLASVVRHALETFVLPPDRLRLEVTETAVMQVGGASLAFLGELTAQGVRLSLDDFGTGYSSMSHLSRLPVDILKIDLGFVRMMDHGPRHLEIVKTIVDLAHNLGMRVVAEGVEHPRQRETLFRLGCEYCQGYLFARPMPADDMEALLAARL